MTRLQFRNILAKLELSQQGAADLVGVSLPTAQRWARWGCEGPAAILLKLVADGKVSITDVERAHASHG